MASLALFLSSLLSAMKPVDSSCEKKKIQPQLWVTQHTPARWATDSVAWSSPDIAEHPQSPHPQSAVFYQVVNTKLGSEVAGAGLAGQLLDWMDRPILFMVLSKKPWQMVTWVQRVDHQEWLKTQWLALFEKLPWGWPEPKVW